MAIIVIADDSPIIQRILSYTLQRLGHEIITVGDGRAALDYLLGQAVDLLIADISMPELSGIELLRQLRLAEHLKNLPVVMLTASGDSQDQTTASLAGASAFLTKPASSRDLVAVVNRLLVAERGTVEEPKSKHEPRL